MTYPQTPPQAVPVVEVLTARKLALTVYANEKTPAPEKTGSVTWEKLLAILRLRDTRSDKRGRAFSLHRLHADSTRKNSNVRELSGFVGDFDSGVTLDDLRPKLSGLAWAAYSSHSHDPENGRVKFRVIVPFTRNVPASEWPEVWAGANAMFDSVADSQCTDPARLYYLPSCPAATTHHAFFESEVGDYLDPDKMIEIARGLVPKQKPNLNDALSSGMDKNLHRSLPETPENIAEVRRMLGFIPASCNRAQYLKIMWSVLATGWSVAEELAREWAMTDPKYDPVEFNKNVLSFNPHLKDGVSFGTLVHHAKLNGYVETGNTESDPIKSTLRKFNDRYFVARIGGGVFVFDERDEAILAGGMAFTAFQQLNAGYVVDGAKIAAKWLNWSDRRTYPSIIFDPAGGGGNDSYNTWRGLSVTPAAGACERILVHIQMVWCGGIDAQYYYVIRWLAMLMQRPWYKPEVALVLRSKEGTGKTIIVQILLKILGQHGFTAAQKEQVAGRFNGHLFDKVLVVLEEAFFAGDPAAVSATKALVTNRTLGYEAKGKDSFNAANYAHVISLTNHSWAVPAGEDSRRWMVLDVDDSKRGDHAYFAELSAEISNGGDAAFLHHLLSVDLTGWNPRAFPDSKALRAQQSETLSRTNPVAAWWMNVLADGSFTVENGAIDWEPEISAAYVHDSYLRASARMRNAPSWDAAAKQLRKLVPPGALGRIRRSGQEGRLFFYRLPDLDEARAYFRTVTGVDPCEA